MKDYVKIFNQCKLELDAISIPYNKSASITTNKRKVALGVCRFENGNYTIEISERVLKDEVTDEGVREVIMHELLHTGKGCMKHTGNWLEAAKIVNKLLGYHIQRTCDEDILKKYNITMKKNNTDFKYIVKCTECGATWKKHNKSPFIKNLSQYRCTCGGSLTLIKS